MNSTSTNQHYVPQFTLRNFASGRSKQVFVFDKATGKSFKTAVRNVAAENGFYDFEVDGVARSLDPLLSKLESATNDIIRKIIQVRRLGSLNSAERTRVALFAAAQILRTRARRKQFQDLNETLCSAIRRMGLDPARVRGFQSLNEEQLRTEAIRSLPELARDLAPHLLNKSWILYSPPQQSGFYISDDPVTLHNTLNQDPLRGTLGLAVRGIEVYLPLGRTLCLGFLCPSIETMVRESHEKATRLGAPIPPHVQSFIKALDGEGTLSLTLDSVTHHNSLQVISAERYVFSANSDFALVREMLLSHPELKDGQRYSEA